MSETRGVIISQGPIYWPEKNTVETLTYALDMSLTFTSGDEVATVSAMIPWTVSGDAQVIQLTSDSMLINVQIAGGQPGVTYAVIISGTSLLGNTFEETALLPISAPFVEAGEQVPTPVATVAATLTWAYAPSMDFGSPSNSMYL